MSAKNVDLVGVVLVTFGASDVITHCLESLAAAQADRLRIVVVDNASPDDTVAQVRDWASGATPYSAPPEVPFDMAPVPKPVVLHEVPEGQAGLSDVAPAPGEITLLHAGGNLGFAGGVNQGLAWLARDPAVQNFWVLNPDSMVPAGSVSELLAYLETAEDFGLLGGRVVYLENPDRIQIDGGLVKTKTGVTGNFNLGQPHPDSPVPDPAALDFITGASMIASRRFYEQTGPMREDYFLYYEEVDWAMRREDLPLAYCAGLLVYHWGGTAIGSPTLGRNASAFSLYFKHRGRMMFMRRFQRANLPGAYAYSVAQALRQLLRRSPSGAWAILAASFGLTPPADIRERLGPETAKRAFSGATEDI